jgi:hypothetical protein
VASPGPSLAACPVELPPLGDDPRTTSATTLAIMITPNATIGTAHARSDAVGCGAKGEGAGGAGA